ncbi:glyoxylase I 4-like [Henckelia pumila]|uniref:glyoxylase I 4-like n=1 Tax=Henckelia pumila TaxID=405737 RepID=UPI003C6E8575
MGKEINVDEAGDRLMENSNITKLPLLSLNHVSFICKSVKKSVEFYTQVLGFVLIKRPSSFDFEGAWLFSHGIGIHLLEVEKVTWKKDKIINPKDNHISFQCSDMDVIMSRLEEMKIEYVKAIVREGGIIVDQIFFHDPDGYMIEICNCQNIPILPMPTHSTPINSSTSDLFGKVQYCSGEAEALMMENNLATDLLNISI